MRSRGLGPVYQCDPEPKAQWLVEHAGIPREWIVRAHDFPAPRPMHWTEWWLAIAMRDSAGAAATAGGSLEAGADRCASRACMWASRPARTASAGSRSAGGRDAPLVLIQAGNKRTLKRGRRVGSERCQVLAAAALGARWRAACSSAMPGRACLLTGAPVEHAVVEAIRRAAASPRVHNLATDMTVPRLLALLERADSMISVDTGPAHAAAALDCPLTVMFAHADQRWWRPRSRLGRVSVVGGTRGEASRLLDIEVPQVLEAWSALGGRRPRRRVRLLKGGKSGRILRPPRRPLGRQPLHSPGNP